MSTKTLITMTAIAVCLTVAAVLMDDGRDSRAAWERVQKPLYASLKEQGDQVAEILIQSASETTTLVREGEEWSVVERGATVAEACLAKQTACDAATYVCDQAVQLHGGTGYMHGTEVERHYRDARILPIGGGATEVLIDLAAKLLGYAPTRGESR